MSSQSALRPDLFQFLDYRRYLSVLCDHLKETTRYFSFRYLAPKAGFSSPNYVQLVIAGKRNLTHKSLRPLMDALGLTPSKQTYFEQLVFFNQARSPEDKEFYYKKLLHLKRGPSVRLLSKDQYDYFSNWYTPAVRELLTVPAFKGDAEAIGKSLSPAVSKAKVRKSIALLERLGLVRRRADGAFEQADVSISTEREVGSLAAFKYHEKAIGLGGEALRRYKANERYISGLTLGISKKGFERIKERQQAFFQELHKIVAEEKTVERVYMLNLQLFPVSKGAAV